MAKLLTSEQLIKTSLRRAMIPHDQSTFTSQDILDIMNEEFGIHVLPVILRAHEEYYLTDEDTPLSSETLRYKIPYRAVGNKLREVQFSDSSGSLFEMTRVSVEDRPSYQRSYSLNSSQFLPFYLESDEIVLMGNQTSSSGAIRFSYYLRPSDLVLDNRGSVISAINVVDDKTVVTLNNFPEHFSVTDEFDFVQGKSPAKIIGFDLISVTVNPALKTATFTTSDLVDNNGQVLKISKGDYLMAAEETIVAQIPTELQPILAQRTAVKMLEALGDLEGMKMAQNELERMEYNSQSLIDNRVEGAPQKINIKHSTLKSSLTTGLYGRRGR